jgi:hypothetical protein
MSTSIVEYSSSEQTNISAFYMVVIIYTLSLCYLMISNFRLKKKLEDSFDKLLEKIDEVNDKLIKKIDIDRKSRHALKKNIREMKDELKDELKDESYLHVEEVRNALLSKLFDINVSHNEINTRIDYNIESLQKKIEGIEFKQGEHLAHLKKEIDKLSDALLSKIKFDDAFSLYQESPDRCEAKNFLFLLKNIDRITLPSTFESITQRCMDNLRFMTLRRDFDIVYLIRFFIDNKLIVRTMKDGRPGCYLSPFDFSKGLEEVKNDIFRRYKIEESDKEWLKVNVFCNKKLF